MAWQYRSAEGRQSRSAEDWQARPTPRGTTLMRIIFLGPPGAGKGTQSKRLLDYLGVPHMSTGDMLRHEISSKTDIGRRSQQYMNSGHLVPDPIILEMMGHRLDNPDCANGCLFDGFPGPWGRRKR